ncbi:ABC transporter permease [Eggerthella sinensis]|uniref:ABC transporter permease n=1 Tax=Eggerthella sinensis TaxID=242230 RepID=UPI0022E67388|nr:ABC transporter permease [Eggerthella sinensis]
MLEKAKGAKYVVPLVVVALAACLFGLVFYPMANMEMKNLPFAVLSLDEGAQTPQGEMNVGDTLVENMVSSADAEDAPIAWTVLDSQDELDEAFENNEFYGALVVPEGYTAARWRRRWRPRKPTPPPPPRRRRTSRPPRSR